MKWVRSAMIPLLIAAFASSAIAGASSTATKSPEERAKEALAKWKTTLKLTEEQAPQFESIMTDSYTKMAAAKTDAAGDKAKMKTSMDQILKDRAAALAKVLTPDQMKTYEKQVNMNVSTAKKHMKS